MDAFDTDVLIYAAIDDHPLGRRVRALFNDAHTAGHPAGVGSVLLLPELLAKPARDGAADELAALGALVVRLHLHPVDEATARLAVTLGASYRLRAVDAVHLATAVATGADRFLTNNSDDFPTSIREIDVTYPDMLADPGRVDT